VNKVRLGKEEDRAYIAASMFKYLLARNNFNKEVGKLFNPYFDSLMESHQVKVVYNTEAPEIIMGYCVYKENDEKSVNIHFLYTRYSFRGCGLATLLLDAVTSDYDSFFYFLSTPRIDGIILETNEKKEVCPTRSKLISKANRIKTPEMLLDFSSKATVKNKTPPKST